MKTTGRRENLRSVASDRKWNVTLEASTDANGDAHDGRPLGSPETLARLFVPPQFVPGSSWQHDGGTDESAMTAESPGSTIEAPPIEAPLAADVSAGKNEPLYRAHPYHTKVPYQAIVPYIRHYTRPGDVVLDGFCGSGMTGVAAQLAGADDASGESARRAILTDLSPLAGLLAYHNNMPIDPDALRDALRGVVERAAAQVGWIYATLHAPSREQVRAARRALAANRDPRENSDADWGGVEFVLWSDVFACPHCAAEVVYHDMAVAPDSGRVREPAACPSCRQAVRKRQLKRIWNVVTDKRLGARVKQARRVPVRISYTCGGKRFEKTPDAFDLALFDKLRRTECPCEFPSDRMPPGDESRRNDSIGLTHVHHYYPPASLWALGALAAEIRGLPDRLRQAALLVHSAVNLYSSWLRRFRAEKKGGGPLSGTLYVSSLTTPLNALHSFARNSALFVEAARTQARLSGQVRVSVQSSTAPVAPAESVDYVFVDPPFGGNLMYAELNFLWEAWLGAFTNSRLEAVENRAVGKSSDEYQALLTVCFRRFHEALKPGRWMTVVFHHSRPHIWRAVQAALHDSGFEVVDVRTMDKRQASFKQINHPGAVRQDLVISTRKPLVAGALRPVRSAAAGDDDVWTFVRQRLASLAPDSDERRDYLLYDRMVADRLNKGIQVSLSAVDFYAGLRERFREAAGRFHLHDLHDLHNLCDFDGGFPGAT